ncbi:CaiB/BaiF CoA transferase family protein [Nocardia sp. NPDC059239]|uniref:CaiB/BaiF CoA transferase family protein n=1 Tax=unclassified Nocardia TaxID=2637762 RepID=UPI003680F419
MSPAALEGVRVLEAATLGAAPFACTLLAELGAQVTKIEPPGKGDPLRAWGNQKDGIGLLSKSLGRNKQGISLNLRSEQGRDILRDLVRQSDVVVFNFRPQTLKKWGLDYESLAAINPGVIVLQVTGFGSGGPYEERPGFGTIGEAMSGFSHVTGQKGGPPTLPRFMLADGVASLSGAYAILAALYHRDANGGTGQCIDMSLWEPMARLAEQLVLEYDQLGLIAERNGNRWDISAPRNAYQTKDKRWIAMASSAPSIAMRVFRAIGRDDMADNPEFQEAQSRLKHAELVDTAVAEWIAERTLDEAMAVFVEYEVAAGPIYDAQQIVEDPHGKARGMHVRVPDDELGSMLVQGPIAKFSKTPGEVRHLGPGIGQDNRSVYASKLGLTDAEIDELERDGII